jgi:hypothetical protein
VLEVVDNEWGESLVFWVVASAVGDGLVEWGEMRVINLPAKKKIPRRGTRDGLNTIVYANLCMRKHLVDTG